MQLVSFESAQEFSEIDLKVVAHFCPLFFQPKIRESVTADFTTHGRSHIYGLPCPSTDSLDPMDHFCTFDVSKIIPKNTYYLLYAAFNPFLAYIVMSQVWCTDLNTI